MLTKPGATFFRRICLAPFIFFWRHLDFDFQTSRKNVWKSRWTKDYLFLFLRLATLTYSKNLRPHISLWFLRIGICARRYKLSIFHLTSTQLFFFFIVIFVTHQKSLYSPNNLTPKCYLTTFKRKVVFFSRF